jgi:hypothetical protein
MANAFGNRTMRAKSDTRRLRPSENMMTTSASVKNAVSKMSIGPPEAGQDGL